MEGYDDAAMDEEDGVEWEEPDEDGLDLGQDVLHIEVKDRAEGGEQQKGKGKKRGGGALELGEEGGGHKKKKAHKAAPATLRYDNKAAQTRCSAFLSESLGSGGVGLPTTHCSECRLW